MGIEHLNEPAHMCAFKLFGQVDKHPDGGHGALDCPGFITNLDGKTEASHADFVDAQLAIIRLALLVVQVAGTCANPSGGGACRPIISWVEHEEKGNSQKAFCK